MIKSCYVLTLKYEIMPSSASEPNTSILVLIDWSFVNDVFSHMPNLYNDFTTFHCSLPDAILLQKVILGKLIWPMLIDWLIFQWNNFETYALLLISFLLCWIEVWMFESKVLKIENQVSRYLRELRSQYSNIVPNK